jgi:hypothetical protein
MSNTPGRNTRVQHAHVLKDHLIDENQVVNTEVIDILYTVYRYPLFARLSGSAPPWPVPAARSMVLYWVALRIYGASDILQRTVAKQVNPCLGQMYCARSCSVAGQIRKLIRLCSCKTISEPKDTGVHIFHINSHCVVVATCVVAKPRN